MQRIAIVGNGAGGKTTLARALGQALDLPVHHVDSILGSTLVIRGTVVSVLGSHSAAEEVVLAALLPERTGTHAHLRIALEPSRMQTDFANFCQVGRTVQVRIARPGNGLPVVSWVKSLWFSIS